MYEKEVGLKDSLDLVQLRKLRDLIQVADMEQESDWEFEFTASLVRCFGLTDRFECLKKIGYTFDEPGEISTVEAERKALLYLCDYMIGQYP